MPLHSNHTQAPGTPLIKRLPANRSGRDFVVGDLHGCRTLLDELLLAVRFDPGVDRLFSVGDLVSRGPDSMATLALLDEPWFHAVRGNHEAMLMDYVGEALKAGGCWTPDPGHQFLYYGDWIHPYIEGNQLSPDLRASVERVQILPCLLVIGEGVQRFHVVHAGLSPRSESDGILNDTSLDRLCEDGIRDNARDTSRRERHWLWSRERVERPDPAIHDEPGLSLTFSGHTILSAVTRRASHLFIDTGAFLCATSSAEDMEQDEVFENAGLTLIEVATGRGWLHTGNGQITVLKGGITPAENRDASMY